VTISTVGEKAQAFVPSSLPPRPPIDWTPELRSKFDQEPGVPLDDAREVSNYVAALDHGLCLMEKRLPLSLRLFREIHSVLLTKGRGSNQTPGEFRRSQNWIGGTRPRQRCLCSNSGRRGD